MWPPQTVTPSTNRLTTHVMSNQSVQHQGHSLSGASRPQHRGPPPCERRGSKYLYFFPCYLSITNSFVETISSTVSSPVSETYFTHLDRRRYKDKSTSTTPLHQLKLSSRGNWKSRKFPPTGRDGWKAGIFSGGWRWMHKGGEDPRPTDSWPHGA